LRSEHNIKKSNNNSIFLPAFTFDESTDLIETTEPDLNRSMTEVLHALNTWDQGFSTTVNALVPEKSLWYAIPHKQAKGVNIPQMNKQGHYYSRVTER
jgi:hypothetical protein